jgi:hypothetical protein
LVIYKVVVPIEGLMLGCEKRLHDIDASMLGDFDLSSRKDLTLFKAEVYMDELDPHSIGEIMLLKQMLEIGYVGQIGLWNLEDIADVGERIIDRRRQNVVLDHCHTELEKSPQDEEEYV